MVLSPVPPPFDTVVHPYILGDLTERLREGMTDVIERLETQPLALSDVEPQLLMLRGAVAIVDAQDPLRALVEAVEARWRAGRRT